MRADGRARLRGALPLPRFVQHPLTALIVAAVHVYLAAGHLPQLFSGAGVYWADIWKGLGALAGAYVFAALASRGWVRYRAARLLTEQAGPPSVTSPSTAQPS